MINNLKRFFGFYSLNDYLTKDKNGITLLENLLMQDVELNYNEESKLINSIEAGYIYAKYNKKLYGFKYNEEQLFTKINGVYFIEYLCSKGNFTCNMIKSISSHIEIIDILIKYDLYGLYLLNKKVVNKLFDKDENNNYLIEKYINDDFVMKILIKKFDNSSILLELCKKYNMEYLLISCNESALMGMINDKETLLDYLLNKKLIPDKLRAINKNGNFIKFIFEKHLFDYLKDSNEDVLLIPIDKGKTLLELLLEKNVLDKLSFIVTNDKTIKLLDKFNKLYLIEKINIKLLVNQSKKMISNGDKKTLLEYLLDNGYSIEISDCSMSEEQDKKLVISILYKKEEYILIFNLINKDLFYVFDDGNLLIDKLLEKNINIFKLKNISLSELFNKYDSEQTYLDCILEKIKNKEIKYNLNNFSLYNYDINEMVNFYITLAKHDMIKYIREIKVDDLLKKCNGKFLLEELLIVDRDLTLNKILNNEIKSDIRIVIFLRSKNINLDIVDVPLLPNTFSFDYLNDEREKYNGIIVSEYGEYLLNELRTLFINDGESDYDLVNSLIVSYRQALSINYRFFIKELENLIEIKRNNKDFKYLKIKNGNFFRKQTGSVLCDTICMKTLMHETGHALHYYLANMNCPDNFEEVLEKTRNNKNVIKNAEVISNNFFGLKDKVKSVVELRYKEYFKDYYTDEKNNEINEFLLNLKNNKRKEFINLGVDDSIIDDILKEIIDREEYVKTQKRLYVEEQTDLIMRNEYGALYSLCDMLDGIFEGDLYSNNLLNDDNNIIKSIPGHGIPYYSCNFNMIFTEMIADFSTIIKCNNSQKYLILLKNVIGEDLFNIISDFYYNNIIYNYEDKKTLLLK